MKVEYFSREYAIWLARERAKEREKTEPAVLIEESGESGERTIIKTFANVVLAREALQGLVVELAARRRCFGMEWGRKVTCYRHRLGEDNERVRFISARYEIKYLSEVTECKVRDKSDLLEYICDKVN